MCYILKSVFCKTPEGQFEFKGLDQWLLGCSANPSAECHFNHPASFLNRAAHQWILTRIGNDTTVPNSLHRLQEEARQLLKNKNAKIQDLKNVAFIFFPRWMEDKVLCRQVGLRGEELIMRLDGAMQAGCPPLTIDMQALRSAKEHSLNSSAQPTRTYTSAPADSTKPFTAPSSSSLERPKRSCAKY